MGGFFDRQELYFAAHNRPFNGKGLWTPGKSNHREFAVSPQVAPGQPCAGTPGLNNTVESIVHSNQPGSLKRGLDPWCFPRSEFTASSDVGSTHS